MASPVHPGDLVAGKYVIERVLGEGGMGVVVAATEVALGRKVAIKFLLPEGMRSEEAVVRFQREARAAAMLTSSHVPRVLDVGKLENGAPFLVMEHLEGEDLATRLDRGQALSVGEAVSHAMAVCEVLVEAHGLGIVHRDLKPSNLFLARDPAGAVTLKVLDFGISKEVTPSLAPSLTRTSALMGSPLYMSPEQLRESRSVDGRADLWSLGASLYEMLAGVPPFQMQTLAELCSAILTTSPPPLNLYRADVPPGLEAVVLRCLEKELSLRIQSAAELAAALAPFAAGAPPFPFFVMPALGRGTTMDQDRTANAVSRTTASSPRPARAWWMATGVAVLVACVGGAALLFASRAAPEARVATPPPTASSPPSASAAVPAVASVASVVPPPPAASEETPPTGAPTAARPAKPGDRVVRPRPEPAAPDAKKPPPPPKPRNPLELDLQ